MAGLFSREARAARKERKLEKRAAAVNKDAGKQPPSFMQNPVSFLFYFWYTKVLTLGYKRQLQMEDEFALPHQLKTENTYPAFAKDFERRMTVAKETEKGRHKLERTEAGKVAPFLWAALFKSHWHWLLLSVLLQFLYSAFNFSGPVILGKIVGFLQQSAAYKAAQGAQLPPGIDAPGKPNVGQAYLFAFLIFAFPMVGAVALVHSNRIAIQVQIRLRAELTSAVYRKALRLSARAKQQTETGRVVNLMSADVNNVMQFFYPMMSQLVIAPCILIAALILLWFQIRWATFIGLGMLMAGTPATGFFVRRLTKLRRRMLLETDSRVKLMNQLLTGIRVLKLYAWEAAQEASVMEARKRELGRLRQAVPYRIGMQVLLFATPTLAAVISFAAYGSAEPDRFTAPRIFSAIAYFSLMRFPLVFLPFALVQLGNAMVSMRRLNQFLVMEERSDDVEHLDTPGAQIEGGEFFWAEPPKAKEDPKAAKKKLLRWRRKRDSDLKALPLPVVDKPNGKEAGSSSTQNGGTVITEVQRRSSDDDTAMEEDGKGSKTTSEGTSPPSLEVDAVRKILGTTAEEEEAQVKKEGAASWWLRSVDVAVPQGQLVAIVGRVGSGKSSLVSALLGEMERSAGRVALGGKIAYVAQQAWILNDTVVNNILFGQPFDEDKWNHVVEACSLAADLEVLPGGAETEIGEKGINLSGGQKQRISMARAVYANADLYIMDDVLSAVDVHVGRHIFEACILEALKGKTRVFVTNQLQYLNQVDRVLYVQQGRIVAQGSYAEVQRHPNFSELLAEFNSTGADAGSSSDADDENSSDVSDPPEVDDDEMRIQTRIRDEALGAAPRTAAALSPGTLRRRPTFKVVTEEDEHSFHLEPADSRELRPRSSRSLDTGGGMDRASSAALSEGSSKGDGFLRMPTFVQQRRQASAELSEDGSLPHGSRRSLHDSRRSLHDSRRSLQNGGSRRSIESRRSLGGDGGKPNSRRSMADDPACTSPDLEKGDGVTGVAKKNGSLIISEDREEGQVGNKVYWFYMKAYGLPSCAALLFCWSAEQSIRVLTNWWLSQWTASETRVQIGERLGQPVASQRGYYIGGYLGFAVAFVVMTFLRSTVNLYSALRGSRLVHKNSLATLVGAPVSWFDTTPIGRILNRFSKDTDDMDYLLPQSVTEFGNCIMQLLSTLIFISIIQPYFLAGMIPLMAIYYVIQKFYRSSYIELQRIDATTRSPIYAHFSETLTGVETLRAYGFQDRFALSNEAKVDYNHRAYFGLRMADQWLSWRLDVIAATLILIVAMLAIAQRDTLSPSLTALSLTEVLDVTGFLKYAVQAAAMFESRFNSVERLLAYTYLPQEAARTIEGTTPKDNWPTEGAISYRDVWMRYRPELPPVLKGVTFDVASSEKIGIVGRTGSGKSSLIVSLFRIVEPHQGAILMDGVDLLSLGLQEVRSRIAAIPQDPVLFSGTCRTNLDPFARHSDAELWQALQHVDLKDVVLALDGGLEARVAEGGDNWSVGQRQLLCVARALLRKPRVLVLDEATASVDGATDAVIQRTIRANFQACTCLTIAHRINTILDSSKVLVMDDGRVGEFDTVPHLMANPESAFRAMVVEAGHGAAFGV